ncbi:MAG: beta-galactosidase [Opitutales bacterium]
MLRSLCLICCLLPASAVAMNYTIDLNLSPPALERGHLDLGGDSPSGERLDANSLFLERDGRPFFPVVGEFHYARYPREHWEESLRKLQAGGLTTVATYTFWNLHEREQGVYDFAGDLDLRHFVELAGEVGIEVIVRIGPFFHSEMRNGGMPDWLYGQPYEVRSNDAGYLEQVDRWYGALGQELRGLFHREGGPIIGVQLENEYQHSAAPWEITYPGAPPDFTVADLNRAVTHVQISATDGQNPHQVYGETHMRTLRELSEKHGMIAPYYTATGWGNAVIAPLASLPVGAGYPYPFWAPARPSPLFLYTDLRQTPDYAPVSYDPARYPVLSAEIGPGIAVRYDRRPYYPEESLAPLMVRLLGSGANGIGYYMYHGGSTPVYGRFMSEESLGHLKINYDFQAPLGEYGQVRSHFHEVRLLHTFLAAFGEQLAPLGTVLPASQTALAREDLATLRFAARAADGRGFIFLHHFQDHVTPQPLEGVALEIEGEGGTLRLPSEGDFDLSFGSWAVLPVNLPVGKATLRTATVQPLTVLDADGERPTYVFVGREGMAPELVFAAGTVVDAGPGAEVETVDAGVRVSGSAEAPFAGELPGATVLVLPASLATQAYPLADGRHLVLTDGLLLPSADGVELRSRGATTAELQVYPATAALEAVTGASVEGMDSTDPLFSRQRVRWAEDGDHGFAFEEIGPGKWQLTDEGRGLGDAHDVFLEIDYVGDYALGFQDGALVADHFYHAKTWEVGLRRFAPGLAADEAMIFRFFPLRRDAPFLAEFDPRHRPDFAENEDRILRVEDVRFVPERRSVLRVSSR